MNFKIFLWLILLPTAFCFDCPQDCPCQTGTYQCQVCLQYYLQTYVMQTKQCQCLPGFTLSDQVLNFCRPQNCQKIAWWGCATCYPNSYFNYLEILNHYQCTCFKNYYLDENNLCRCKSHQEPTRYFQDIVHQDCHLCPLGCKCNSKGCIECRSQLLRQINNNPYSSTCHCQYPHTQVNGTCQCARNCLCFENGTTICNPISNRILQINKWVCKHPYTQYEGECICPDPYVILIDKEENQQCICLSKVDETQYYEINGQCRNCPEQCRCDHTGCIRCYDDSAFIHYQQCVCNENYIWDGYDCICVSPYQLIKNTLTGKSECVCLNNRLANFYSFLNFCSKCPFGCQCNQQGCFQCPDPLRVYSNLSSSFQICMCANNSKEVGNSCSCQPYYVFNKSTRQCECKYIPTLLVYDTDINSCYLCPGGCLCDESGCYSCISQSSRSIQVNSKGIKVCYCLPYFQQNKNKICSCVQGYRKHNDTTCKSKANNVNVQINSSLYFYDSFQNKCKVCPPGCTCNISGCISCGVDFLRTIKYSLKQSKYRCPCLQTAFAIGEYCSVCNNNSYPQFQNNPNNITCIKCTQCLTCSRFGCTSCPEDMLLVNKSCVCINGSLINLDGVCTCPLRQYLLDDVCHPCPLKCDSCTQINRTVSCSSCGLDVNRQNRPELGCPCQDQYKQSNIPSEYCCLTQCEYCDSDGCLSCPLHTFRVLVDGECICPDGFIQENGSVCICPNDSYLLNGQCFKCPIQCQTCHYHISKQIVTCLSCLPQVNRNQRDQNCKCLRNYSETSIKSQYCYATHCAKEIIQCQGCVYPWEKLPEFEYCLCRVGHWINKNLQCVKCSIEGCLECLRGDVCTKCDEDNNYYLVKLTCLKGQTSGFSIAQIINKNIVIQYPLSDQYSKLNSISASLNPIMRKYSPNVEDQIQLEVIQKRLFQNGSVLFVSLKTVNQTVLDIILSLVIEVEGDIESLSNTSQNTNSNQSNDSSNFKVGQGLTQITFHLKTAAIYSEDSFNTLQNPSRIGLYCFIVFVLIISFLLYLYGVKQNQTLYFIQTMSLAGFSINDIQLTTAMFLYNLRYSYYNFSSDNALSRIIPNYYLENSRSNYRYLNVDSNIVRNIGIPLILALVIAILAYVFRGVYHITRAKTLIQPVALMLFYKKIIYRAIQFFYKTLMYPLIFFSIQNLVNWKASVYIHSDFRTKSLVLSIIILLLYLSVTLYQYFAEMISIFHKRQNLKQFLNCVFGSLIITGSQYHSEVLVLFIVIFIASQLSYFRFYVNDQLEYRIINVARVCVVILEIVCVILVVTTSKNALIGVFCVTVLLQMALMIYQQIMEKHYNLISKLTSYGLNEVKDKDREEGSQSDKQFYVQSEV